MSLPPLGIQLHPGPGNEYSVIRWTAPFSGVANINAAFEGLNPDGTTTDVHVWHNGTALYDASVNGFGLSSRVAFQGTATVVIGDTIDFGVGYGNGSHYSDSTLLEAAVTFKPSGGAIFLRQGLYSIVETNTSLPVQVLRVGPDFLDVPITVDYSTVDETAHAGEDFTATSGTLHFAAGETEKVISIPILNDALKESEEQFHLVLSNPTGGVSLGNSNVVIRLQDNDPGVRFMSDNVIISETAGVVTIAMNRGDDLNLPFTVDYATVEGTAHAGEDYVAASGTLHFAAGQTTKQITISILDDALKEPEEQFRLVLNNPTGGVSLDNSNVVIRIQSDELPDYYYVNVANSTPASPYTSWATAATNIQDAVDAGAELGRVVLVTNGVYRTGSVWDEGTNRVVLPNQVVLRSVNGPAATIIDGGGSVRCAHLAANAMINGFTLTNGKSLGYEGGDSLGGGAYGGTLTNCTLIGNSAPYGGGAFGSKLYDCTLAGNSAGEEGGGAHSSTLYNCTLTGNSATWAGGGANSSTLSNCTLTGNSAGVGGGVSYGTLYNCTLSGNSARGKGGGAYGDTTLYNCTLTGNSAGEEGGGTYGHSTLYNCTLTRNSAVIGGGVHSNTQEYPSTLYNCTLTGNSAALGGGVFGGSRLYNCIVVQNEGGNHAGGSAYYNQVYFENSCTTFLYRGTYPQSGSIEVDPQMATTTHLSSSSPCLGAGSASYTRGVDIDGEPWANPPCMGADQLVVGGANGALTMSIETSHTRVAVGHAVALMAHNQGRILYSLWDFGDGTVVTNQAWPSHVWNTPGSFTVRLTGYNDSFPAGVTTTTIIEVIRDPVCYVSQGNPSPVFPYTSWATAATNIQDAVTAVAGSVVLVSNGVYRTGTMLSFLREPNRVALVDVLLQSVNGPDVTIIDGEGSVRCAYLGTNATLSGFTLRNGSGGGTTCADATAVVTNCIISGNAGGGVSGGTLYNCTVTGNSGGGVHGSILRNCVLTSNLDVGAQGSTLYNCTLTANSGLGANECSLYNCIVYHNRTSNGANHSGSTFEYSCTSPLPPGLGNIAADPQLVSASRLSPASPCLGAGSATYASGLDIDGEPWSNPPDMGADQLIPGSFTGSLTVRVEFTHTRFAAGYAVPFVAQNTGRILASVWDFGDGTVITNQAFVSHAWTAPGVYTVRLTGYNDSFPAGVTSTVQVEILDAVHYVNVANPNPVLPYTSWATAATNIQDAVDAGTELGRVVLVTNGIYRTGSVWVNVQSRVALPSGVVLRSVNGPSVTLIEGVQGPDEVFDAIGCVYVGDGALVSGFTLTNGARGAYCEPFGVVTNCVITGNSAGFGYGGAVYGGTLFNCTLTGNSAGDYSGGAHSSTLYNCTLTGNSATFGGGVYASTLYNCTLTGNSATEGGGAHLSTLYGCTLTGNSAGGHGGGAYGSTLYGCRLSANTAQREGGGTYGNNSMLYNCTVTGNSATVGGGGAAGGTLYNCVVMGNSAEYGGGVAGAYYRMNSYLPSKLRNCIVYSNQAPSGANYGYATFEYSCTSPLPTSGIGNIDADPGFVNAATGDYHLLPESPCIDTGTNLSAFLTTDLDGLPRPLDGNGDGVARFDMGAYEFNPYRFSPTLQFSPDGFQFTVRGEPGKSVRIERSRDLVHWEFAGQVPIPASGQTLIDPAATTEPRLFYRVIAVP